MTAQRRRLLITQILDSNEPRTQEDIVTMLADAGITATQTTISRDLNALGAIRGRGGYRFAGALSEKQDLGSNLSGLFKSHALGIQLAHSIVVIKTAPGHAQLLAVGFDQNPPSGIIGCIAGDDTIFLATNSPKTAATVLKELDALLKGDPL